MFNVNNTYIRISGCIINVPLNQNNEFSIGLNGAGDNDEFVKTLNIKEFSCGGSNGLTPDVYMYARSGSYGSDNRKNIPIKVSSKPSWIKDIIISAVDLTHTTTRFNYYVYLKGYDENESISERVGEIILDQDVENREPSCKIIVKQAGRPPYIRLKVNTASLDYYGNSFNYEGDELKIRATINVDNSSYSANWDTNNGVWVYERSGNSGDLFAISNLTSGKLKLKVYELGLRDSSLYDNLHASGYKIVGGNMFPISNDTTYKIDQGSPDTVSGYEFNQELNDNEEYFLELETAPLLRATICNVTVSSGTGYIGTGGVSPSTKTNSGQGYYHGASGDSGGVIICDWGYIKGTSSTEFGLNNIRLVEDKTNYVESLSKLAKISTTLSGDYDYYIDDVDSNDGNLLSIRPYVKSDGVLRISCSQNGASSGQSDTLSGMFYLRSRGINGIPSIRCNIWWKNQ